MVRYIGSWAGRFRMTSSHNNHNQTRLAHCTSESWSEHYGFIGDKDKFVDIDINIF